MITALVSSFLGLLASGMPIAFVMGIGGAAFLVFHFGFPPETIAASLYQNLDSFSLMALPFFVLASGYLARGGVGRVLVEMAQAYIGHVPGGLGIVSVLACMVFASLSGSSVATALAVGTIVIPEMIRFGYPRDFALGVVTVAGTLGILIPPSITFIIYGLISEQSIGHLFIAGVIPGILIGCGLIIVVIFEARRRGIRGGQPASWEVRWRATYRAIPAIILPLIVLGGIYSGVFTPTEAAAVSAVYALLISLFFYHTISLRNLIPESAAAMKSAGMVMFIMAGALVFGKMVTVSRIPQHLVEYITSLNTPAWLFLIYYFIIMLILGSLLESVSILLIVLPVVMPMVFALGINPIQFGVVTVVLIEIGCVTPPVGMNLFAISAAGRAPISVTWRGSIPFVAMMTFWCLILMYVPKISTWLPSLMQRR